MTTIIRFTVVTNAKEIKANVKTMLGVKLLRCKMMNNALFVTCKKADSLAVESYLLGLGLMSRTCLRKIGTGISGDLYDFSGLYYTN